VLEAFQPFFVGQEQAGRPVKVIWKLHELSVGSEAKNGPPMPGGGRWV
jgi:hypothetical protein